MGYKVEQMVKMVADAIINLKRTELRKDELGTMAHSLRHLCSTKELIVINTNDNMFLKFHSETGIKVLRVIEMARELNNK